MKNQIKTRKNVLAFLFFGTVLAVSLFAYHNADEYRLNSILKREELRNNFIKTYLAGVLTWNDWNKYFPLKEKSFFICEKSKLKKPLVIKKELVTVVATAYYKPLKEEEKDYHVKIAMNGSGKRTFFGTIPKKGTIAADLRVFPRGTILYVPGYGRGIVEDKGSGIKNHEIDVFMGVGKKAGDRCEEWGRQKIQIKVIWLAKN